VEPEDQILVARIAGGDKGALARLYDRYASVMLAVAFRLLGSRRDAEDLLHDVFLEVWKKASTFDPKRASVRTWLLMRLRSRALDRLKSAHATRVVPMGARGDMLQGADHRADPSAGVERSWVRRAVQALPTHQRAVLELAYFKGLSSSEIAAQLSIPVGTVKSRTAAGMRLLRGALREEPGGAL
jgi:RNA polymerase sigma-70 factor (ECF subfamily)